MLIKFSLLLFIVFSSPEIKNHQKEIFESKKILIDSFIHEITFVSQLRILIK